MKTPDPSPTQSPLVKQENEHDKWYAIYTRSHCEKKVSEDLLKAGFQVFLPMIKEKRVWSDRIKTVSVPLLSSYVFVKLPAQNQQGVLSFPGVVRLVSFGGKPCEVREEEIDLLEKIITHGFPVESGVEVGIGETVRVIRGPLKGWEGRVEQKSGRSRIVFQIASIRQSISIEVNAADIERV